MALSNGPLGARRLVHDGGPDDEATADAARRPQLPAATMRRALLVRRAARSGEAGVTSSGLRSPTPRVVVLGDLVLDVVIAPSRSLRSGTDVAGRLTFRQGGSAGTTARVLARSGLDTSLITALGRDGPGDALEAYLAGCGVSVRAVRIRGAATGRLGVLVEPSGERTFVADRGAILRLRPRGLRSAWFAGVALLHLPVYSLIGEGLAATSRRAALLARREGAAISVDLASAGFLEDAGAGRVLDEVAALRPAVLLANEAEAAAVAASQGGASLLELAPLVVLKRGAGGATAWSRDVADAVAVPAPAIRVRDSTGAGDAFDAGFLSVWLVASEKARRSPQLIRRAVTAGHRAAAREAAGRRVEFALGDLAVVRQAQRRVGR